MCSASRTSDFDTFDEERHDTAGNVPHKQLCIQIHNAKCTTACGSTDLNSHCTVTRTHATPFNTPKSCSVRRSDQCSSDETPWTRRHALRETEVEITPKVGRVMSAQPPTHTHSKAVTCTHTRIETASPTHPLSHPTQTADPACNLPVDPSPRCNAKLCPKAYEQV